MWDFIQWMFTGIIPPRDSSDPNVLYNWQRAVAAAVVVWSTALVIVTLLAFGLTPFYRGFASAEGMDLTMSTQQTALDKINRQLREARIDKIDEQIVQTQERECKAENEKNFEAIGFANDKIRELLNDYYRASGRDYEQLPTCHLLGLQ